MKLLYLAHTSSDIYFQTALSVTSALRFYEPRCICVMTDHAEYFWAFSRLWVDVRQLKQSVLTDRMWEYRYIHRAKICLMSEFIKESEDTHVLLIDADTIHLSKMPVREAWQSYMHINEWILNPLFHEHFSSLYDKSRNNLPVVWDSICIMHELFDSIVMIIDFWTMFYK
jgi:hypothetical protein